MTIEEPKPRNRRKRPAAPTTPDPVEIAMEAEASGDAPTGEAAALLRRHSALIDKQLVLASNEIFRNRMRSVRDIAIAVVVVALLLAFGAVVWNASQSRALIVEPFSVPPALMERGVTGEVVAARVLDRLAEMQRQTVTIRAESSYSNNWQDNVEVNVLDSGFSVGELWRALRQWLGQETRISGEIITGPDGTLIMTTRAGVLSSPPVTADDGDLDALVQKGAEGVYAVTQPYRYTVLLGNLRRTDERERALIALTRAEDPQERRWGYSGLSVFNRTRGDVDAAIANAQKALEIDPQMVPALGNLASAYEVLGRDEKVLGLRQAYASASRRNASDYDPEEMKASAAIRQLWTATRLGDASGIAAARHDLRSARPNLPASAYAGYEVDIARLAHDWRSARSAVSALTAAAENRLGFAINEAELSVAAALDLDDATAAISAAESFRAAVDALALFQAENRPEQLAALDQLKRRDGYSVIAHGLALGGQVDEARALIDQTPLDCYNCVVARGHVAGLAGNRRAAEHWWREAIRIGPSIPMGYEALGRSRLQAGDAAGALALFRTAQEKGPRWADPVKGEADALVRLGRTREALRRYAAAAERAPRWGALHLAWGQALAAEGRSDEARERYRAAAGMDLSAVNRAEVMRRLATGASRF
jgi:Tfp pilus assembly protein PilF